MSADGQPSREVAHRLFAAEFDDATLSYSESDEERAPNYVVMPTGARVNRLFVVGVLTEIEEVGNEQLRARIVDPTGAFVTYAGQYQPDALATLDELSAPAFVAVTGKARTFQPEDSERVYTSIRPESIGTVDATVRDRWTVGTGERTLERVGTAIDAHGREERGDELREALRADGVPEELAAGIPLAFEHYDTTPSYLGAVGDLALDAARVVAGEREEVAPLDLAPDEGGESGMGSSKFDGASDSSTVATGATTAATGDAAATESAAASSGADDGSSGTVEASDTAVREGDGATEVADAADTTPDAEGAADDAIADTDVPVESATTTEAATTSEPEAGGSDVEAETTDTVDDTSTETPSTGPDTELNGEDTTETSGTADAPEPAETGEPIEESAESASNTEDADTVAASDEGTDPEDVEEFELDPEERDRLETEYGTEFERGSEVDDPGEADIETPEPESGADGADIADTEPTEPESIDTAAEADTSDTSAGGPDEGAATEERPGGSEIAAEDTDSEPNTGGKPDTDAEPGTSETERESEDEGTDEVTAGDESGADRADESDEETDESDDEADEQDVDIDLDDAAMDAMEALDDGDGADREAVIESVSDEHGIDAAAVEDAIQDALMNGRCYEPDDGVLKPI